jgi:HJR/Mrr/RecB family endonuclease
VAIRDVIAAIVHYEADYGLAVTNRTFTPGARMQAKNAGVELWERGKLLDYVLMTRILARGDDLTPVNG